MAAKDSRTQDVGKPARAASRTPIAIAMIAIALICISYWMYVRHQTAYFANRDLRLLAWSSGQLKKSLERTSGYVRSFAQWPLYTGDEWKSHSPGHDDPAHEEIAKRYFPGFDLLSRLDIPGTSMPAVKDAGGGKTGFTQELRIQNGKQIVAIKSVDVAEWQDKSHKVPLVGAVGEIPLENIAEPVFRAGFLDVFDVLMVAKPGGEVIYETRPAETQTQSESPKAAADASAYRRDVYKGQASKLMLTDLRQIETKALFHDPQPLSIESLSAETNYAEVMIGGESYIFFSQPCRLFGPKEESADPKARTAAKIAEGIAAAKAIGGEAPKLGAASATAAKAPAEKGAWIVCGLVARDHFRGDSLAISASTVALAVALLLLAVCCWPFLRIALIGEFERLTVADALAVGVGAVIGLSIATLTIVDAIAYQRIQKVTDAQLREFSVWFEGLLRTDIIRADKSLKAIRRLAQPTAQGTTATKGQLESEPFIKNDGDIKVFPYIDSFSWIDGRGMQRAKQSVMSVAPLVSVAERRYFLDARDNNATSFRCGAETTAPIVMESIHSSTTGDAEAVFSAYVHDQDNRYWVVAMTAAMVQAINPVVPPSFGFVIIDDGGNVIFHNDPQRNGNENFFDESDHNRQLRAAVLARRADSVEMKYWGEDQQAYVRPMEGLPWTLIVYRDKRLLETMNVESLVFTLFFLMLFASLLVIALLVCTIVRPRYRAPWAWPSQKKLDRYRRLALVFTLLVMIFIISIITLSQRWTMMVALLLPLISIVSAYLVLRRGRASLLTKMILLAGLLLVALFISTVAKAPVDLNVRFADPVWTKALIYAAVVVLCFLVPIRRKKQRLRPSAEIESAYVFCGVLALLLIAVLPTLGFFKAGWWLELEALLKSEQLTMANRLERRLEFIAKSSARDDPNIGTTYYMPHFYGSWWYLTDRRGLRPPEFPIAIWNKLQRSAAQPDKDALADLVEASLPQYSEESVRMRDLRHSKASDDAWRWSRYGQLMLMEKDVSFDYQAKPRIFGRKKPPERPAIVIVSGFPSMIPQWLLSATASVRIRSIDSAVCSLKAETPDDIPWILRYLFYVTLVITFVYLIIWMVRFIAKSIFLLDLQAPRWLFSRSKLKPTLGDHIFLIRRPATDAATLIDVAKFRTFHLDSLKSDEDISKSLIDLDMGERDVLCLGLQVRPTDGEDVMRQLVFLERLLELPNRTVIIDSTVSPLLIQTMALADKPKGSRRSPRQRWEAVLSRFIWLTGEQLAALRKEASIQGVATASRSLSFRLRMEWKLMKPRLRALTRLFHRKGEPPPPLDPLLPEWLFRETRSDAFLRQLADQVSWKKYSREETLDEIRERADSYYASLWASCSPAEKLLLQQLSKQGLVNGKNRRTIRRLIARGLVRRAPHVRVFSETFRRYVLEVADSQHLSAMEEQSTGLWSSLRVPIGLVTLTIAVIFFASQKDLLNVTTGVVTGLAAGLPALAKLVGLITERRLEAG